MNVFDEDHQEENRAGRDKEKIYKPGLVPVLNEGGWNLTKDIREEIE